MLPLKFSYMQKPWEEPVASFITAVSYCPKTLEPNFTRPHCLHSLPINHSLTPFPEDLVPHCFIKHYI